MNSTRFLERLKLPEIAHFCALTQVLLATDFMTLKPVFYTVFSSRR
jgi:hypothetical protein